MPSIGGAGASGDRRGASIDPVQADLMAWVAKRER